jgi:hypothetical protein
MALCGNRFRVAEERPIEPKPVQENEFIECYLLPSEATDTASSSGRLRGLEAPGHHTDPSARMGLMNVNARMTILVSNDPGCKAWSVFDVRQTGPHLLPRFQTRKKPAFSLHASRSKRRPFNRSLQVWFSAMICTGKQESERRSRVSSL